MYIICYRLFASVVQVRVGGRDLANKDWIKYRVNVLAVFKHIQSSSVPLSMLRGGRTRSGMQQITVMIPIKDSLCHCPKLRVGKTYLLVGARQLDPAPAPPSSSSSSARPPVSAWSLVLDARGSAIRWNERVAQSVSDAGRQADQQRMCPNRLFTL